MMFAGLAVAQPFAPALAQPTAMVSAVELPPQGRQTTYFEAPTAGRYAISAQSKTGVALELIDYMNGPVASDGIPGQRDGRLDRFLDQGRYKLILRGAPQAPAAATITVRPFVELQPKPQRLPLLEPIVSELGDCQQRSYWLEVKERGPVFLEAGGRRLDSLYLWRDGLTLLELPVERRILEPQPGRPLTVLTLDTALDPGFYRVTLYGGRERAPWTQPERGQAAVSAPGCPQNRVGDAAMARHRPARHRPFHRGDARVRLWASRTAGRRRRAGRNGGY